MLKILQQLTLYYLKTKAFLRKHREMLSITKDALVLDIGSGHSPWPRADVICDKFYNDDSQRPGKLTMDRTLVIGDIMNLPFCENAFDYIWCSHVLEHVDDPEKAANELSRVGKKGYIETPSEFHEKLIAGYEYHKWFVNIKDEKLHFKRKQSSVFDKCLVETISRLMKQGENNTITFYKHNYYAKESPFLVKYHWKDKIECLVENSIAEENGQNDNYPFSSPSQKSNKNDNKSGPLDANFIERILQKTVVSILRMMTGKRTVELADILACPSCKKSVVQKYEKYICPNCKKAYPIKDGVPIMLKEHAENISDLNP